MTKAQTRDVQSARIYAEMGLLEAAARGLSASIRCAMSAKARDELLAAARELGVDQHPEFIV